MTSTTARAAALASVTELGLDGLPAEVTRTVVAYDSVMALGLPEPPPGPQAAVTAQAREALSAACRKGSTTIVVDPGPVAAARAAEAAHRDQAAILAALRELAPLELCRTADQHRGQIVAALKARHAQIIAQLVPAAHRLPPGIDDRAALDQGGQVRVDFIAVRGLSAEAERLRAVLTDVEDVPGRGQIPSGLEISLTHIRDPRSTTGRAASTASPAARSTTGRSAPRLSPPTGGCRPQPSAPPAPPRSSRTAGSPGSPACPQEPRSGDPARPGSLSLMPTRARTMPPGWPRTRRRILPATATACAQCGAGATEAHHGEPA